MTNIIHIASKAAIDYISHDPRGVVAIAALGVAGLIATWAWNKRKARKDASTDCP